MTSARYRCAACGNLTRFDVVALRRTRSFHHYSLAGELSIDDEVVLDETVEEVSCRWCGHGREVEVFEDSGDEKPVEPNRPESAMETGGAEGPVGR
jgi:hypothetical protein